MTLFNNKFSYFISSLDKNSNSASNSDFSYTIPLPKNIPYSNVSVESLKITKSYYTIDSSNCSFILNQEGVDTQINISYGFYTVNSLITELLSLLNAVNVLYQYEIDYDSSLGKIVIGSTLGHTQPYFITSISSPLPYLGIPSAGQTVASSGAYIWSGPNISIIQKTSCIHLRTDLVDNPENTLITLYDVNSFSNLSDIIYENNDIYGKARKIMNINQSSFNFKLYDDYDKNLELNGGNVALTLVFWI